MHNHGVALVEVVDALRLTETKGAGNSVFRGKGRKVGRQKGKTSNKAKWQKRRKGEKVLKVIRH